MLGYAKLDSGEPDHYDSFPFTDAGGRRSPVPLYPQGLHKSPVEIAQRRRFLTDGQAPFTGKPPCKWCADTCSFITISPFLFHRL